MRIDLHTHSTASDGTDSPPELMLAARTAGLDVIALTDHESFAGWDQAERVVAALDLRLIKGIEMSTRTSGESVHVLGLWVDPTNRPLADELQRIRGARDGRVAMIISQLAAVDVVLAESKLAKAAADTSSIGRPHIADAMIAQGYVETRREAFDRYLAPGRPGYVSRYAPATADGIRLIHAAGGVAVLAHAWGRDTAQVLTAEVIADLASETGLDGLEVFHQEHDESARRQLGELAKELDLIPTGGSDYHGLGKQNHELGCNLTPPESLAALEDRQRLWATK